MATKVSPKIDESTVSETDTTITTGDSSTTNVEGVVDPTSVEWEKVSIDPDADEYERPVVTCNTAF
jgi:hypothetical protein